MDTRIPAIRQHARLRLRAAAAGLVAMLAIACALAAGPAAADTKYVVDDAIDRVLVRTTDDQGLCRRHGMSMDPLVLFLPKSRPGLSAHWHAPSDRFVQYPGTSACVVWKRR